MKFIMLGKGHDPLCVYTRRSLVHRTVVSYFVFRHVLRYLTVYYAITSVIYVLFLFLFYLFTDADKFIDIRHHVALR